MRPASATMVVMSDTSSQPYQTLGKHLRYLREQQQETLADVSGAVEIDEQLYERIELGQERPAEDILMLLISHFDMQDQEAGQLWELAGYHDTQNPERKHQEELLHEALSGTKPIVLVMGMDARTLYTDHVSVDRSKAGITLQFGQQTSKQVQSIAKLGMSYEQAATVIVELQKALLRADYEDQPRLLPPSTDL
jgi:transcriptional regulator with XRE-family HTH domain